MEPRSNHFLIDYENTRAIDFALLAGHSARVHLFIGHGQQDRLPFALVEKIREYAECIELIPCVGSGKNALDFLIAFHAGRLSRDDPQAFLHLISKDTGFDPLIAHLHAHKILAARSNTFAEAPLFQPKGALAPLPLKQKVAITLQRLTAMAKARPRKRKTLLTTINATFAKQLNEAQLAEIVAQLVKAKTITFDAKDTITYQL